MTKLIKILESVLSETVSEQITMDDDNTHPEKGLSVDEIENMWMEVETNKNAKLEKILRRIFKQMSKIAGMDEYMVHLQTTGEDLYFGTADKHNQVRDMVKRIPKFIGASSEQGVDRHTATTLIYTFINNGGYGRDFTKGTLDLSPLITYDVEAYTGRDTVQHETSWGEVFSDSKEEAIAKMKENPESWISDSQYEDQDSGEFISVENVTISNTNERHLNLANLGFA